MRCVACRCGLVLTAEDDEALHTLGRRHADQHHADQGISDDFNPLSHPRQRSGFRRRVNGHPAASGCIGHLPGPVGIRRVPIVGL
jgi:hypothetical protein